MPPSPLAPPQPADSRKALAELAESERIREITPKMQQFLDALGRDSLSRHADGSWSIRVTDEHWPVERNRSRLRIVNEMMSRRREAQTNGTHRRALERNDVRMVDRNGEARMVPDWMGEHCERKGMRWKMAHRSTYRVLVGPDESVRVITPEGTAR